jgi:TonB family protein
VTQAVPLEQNVPGVPSEVVGRIGPATVVAVVIDATGKVTDVSVRQSSHPLYDRLVLQAARDWRYEPATINGVPVPSERLVTIQTAR